VGYFDWHEEACALDVVRRIPSGQPVLDLGCGTGWLSNHVTEHVGLDGSPAAVTAAAALGRDVRLWRAEDPIPFEDSTFGVVVLKDVLEHLIEPVPVVLDIRRVLRPGGVVLAVTPDAQRWVWDDYTHRRPYTRRGLRRLFTDHDFTIEAGGYDCVLPGTASACRVGGGRRPPPLQLLARLGVNRNVWVRARRS